ncbi:hypothetical protein ACFFX0_18100 [Citricoccus parietis]|uniref:4Fe-4S Wbl-type domain-containing protein n=1 Tax=Citricoccus parietis TaxID=592307 RepID=A0ABV5G242_9MICC
MAHAGGGRDTSDPTRGTPSGPWVRSPPARTDSGEAPWLGCLECRAAHHCPETVGAGPREPSRFTRPRDPFPWPCAPTPHVRCPAARASPRGPRGGRCGARPRA